jgi:hypothetical protein
MASRRQYATDQPLLTNVTTGTSAAIPIPSAKQVSVFVKYTSGVSAGAVVVESSTSGTDTGVWVNEGQSTWAVANSQDRVAFEGPVDWFRVRVITEIVGGFVTVTFNSVGEY